MSSEKKSIKLLTHENLKAIKNKDITVLDDIRNNNTDHVNERLFLALVIALNDSNHAFAEEIKKRCTFTKVDNDLLLEDLSHEGSVYDTSNYCDSIYRYSGYRQHPFTLDVIELGVFDCSATDNNKPVYSYTQETYVETTCSFPNDLEPNIYNFDDLFTENENNRKLFKSWIETFEKDAPVRQLGEIYLNGKSEDEWWNYTPLGKDLSLCFELLEDEEMGNFSWLYAFHPNKAAYLKEIEEIIQHFEAFRFYEHL